MGSRWDKWQHQLSGALLPQQQPVPVPHISCTYASTQRLCTPFPGVLHLPGALLCAKHLPNSDRQLQDTAQHSGQGAHHHCPLAPGLLHPGAGGPAACTDHGLQGKPRRGAGDSLAQPWLWLGTGRVAAAALRLARARASVARGLRISMGSRAASAMPLHRQRATRLLRSNAPDAQPPVALLHACSSMWAGQLPASSAPRPLSHRELLAHPHLPLPHAPVAACLVGRQTLRCC
jgi:hypothetical protein